MTIGTITKPTKNTSAGARNKYAEIVSLLVRLFFIMDGFICLFT